MNDIGYRIKQYREARRMTQTQLAEALGTVKQTISNYERGFRYPSIETVRKIAKILGIRESLLLVADDASDASTFGERLLNYMNLFGDNAASLAIALDTSIEAIQRMCVNDLYPSPRELGLIAQRYGITIDQLVYQGNSGDLIRARAAQAAHDDDATWAARQELLDDPDRRALLHLARHGSAKDVKQVAAIIDALRASNPDFYDGDDPA